MEPKHVSELEGVSCHDDAERGKEGSAKSSVGEYLWEYRERVFGINVRVATNGVGGEEPGCWREHRKGPEVTDKLRTVTHVARKGFAKWLKV